MTSWGGSVGDFFGGVGVNSGGLYMISLGLPLVWGLVM